MNIAIIDDQKTDLLEVSAAVSSYYSSQRQDFHIDHFLSGEDFFRRYTPGSYQLIILDIFMTGMNGMEAARKLRDTGDDCSLIFITSSDAFAVSSYDVQAAYYLLKPFDTAKLHRILGTIKVKNAQAARYLEVISDRTPVRIPVKSILYVDTYRNAVQFHTDAGVIRSYLTFQKFEEMIANDKCFLSCYRGCIVNMDRIREVMEDSFLLDNKEIVQIRKRGLHTIKKEYLSYLFSSEDA